MQVQPFKNYLEEATGDKKFLRLLIITDEPENDKEKFYTAKRFLDEVKKLGYPHYLFKISSGTTSKENGVRRFHNKDDKKGFEIDTNTVAIVRGSVVNKNSYMDFVSMLEREGACVVNNRTTINMCYDKYRATIRLADYGVNQPKTILINDFEEPGRQIEETDIKYPLILKTLTGSKGVGVLFIESSRALTGIVQAMHKQNSDVDLLAQQYIKTDYDVRVHVLSGKILAVMKRPVIEGDFRSNVSQGSVPVKHELTELEIEESLKAAKAMNGLWTAVDFIPGKDRKKDKPYILEVNASAGTDGIEDATGKNLSKEIIEHFADENNRYATATECGHREVVSVAPWGKMVGKFDTGNSVLSVIHGEDIKINKDKKEISFTLLGKRQTLPLIKMYKVKVGSIRDYTEERPVIKLDVGFAGGLYKGEMFGVDDRSDMGTEVLLTRRLMKRMNVMVNPAKKYVITTKYSLD